MRPSAGAPSSDWSGFGERLWMIDAGESGEQAAAEVTSCLLGKTNRQRGEKQSGGIGEVVVVGAWGSGSEPGTGLVSDQSHQATGVPQRLQPR